MGNIKLRDKVWFILDSKPSTRNCDIKLMIAIWEFYHSELVEDGQVLLQDLHKLPREDHIKRYRAKFNAQGRYLPTEEKVAKARKINEDVWREKMRLDKKVY